MPPSLPSEASDTAYDFSGAWALPDGHTVPKNGIRRVWMARASWPGRSPKHLKDVLLERPGEFDGRCLDVVVGGEHGSVAAAVPVGEAVLEFVGVGEVDRDIGHVVRV